MRYAKKYLLQRMDDLEFDMRQVANMMLHVDGTNEEIAQHANELAGAADMLGTWIEGMSEGEDDA